MKPALFDGFTRIVGEETESPLPIALREKGTVAVSCWKASLWERLQFLFTGRVYVATSVQGGAVPSVYTEIIRTWDKPSAPEKTAEPASQTDR